MVIEPPGRRIVHAADVDHDVGSADSRRIPRADHAQVGVVEHAHERDGHHVVSVEWAGVGGDQYGHGAVS